MLSLTWSATSWNCRQKSQTSSENYFTFDVVDVPFSFLCDYDYAIISATWYRFQLKQEQENRRNSTMMYNTTRDKLRRTEEQYQLEVQEKQKVELALRNLELEMRTLDNKTKQVLFWT